MSKEPTIDIYHSFWQPSHQEGFSGGSVVKNPPAPGDLADVRIEPVSPALVGRFFTREALKFTARSHQNE